MIRVQIRIIKGKHEDKIPFSKFAIAYVLFLASAFLFWACYEMDKTGNLEPIAYIGTGVVGLIAAALGFYVWRAKKSDDYALALEKAKTEKRLGITIETDDTISDDYEGGAAG